jgi:hypothetical protein
MSRAILDAPIIVPSASKIGDTVNETGKDTTLDPTDEPAASARPIALSRF